MRIVIPALALECGGGVRCLVTLAHGLAAAGHDVLFLVPEVAPVQWDVRVPVVRVPGLTPEVFPEADVILPNFYPTVPPAVESGMGRVLRLSLGYEPLWVPDPDRARQTYQYNIPIVTISPHLHDLIITDVGRTSLIIPPGIEPSVFHPTLWNWRRSTRHTPRTIMYVYRSPIAGYTFKGQKDFWDAMRLLGTRRNDVTTSLVAPEKYPIEAPLNGSVEYLVTDERLASLYRGADVFVSTSHAESFSLPPLEAMACGTPVVVVESQGLHTYVQPGVNALLVPPDRPEQLAEAIERVLEDAELRAFLVRHGLATASRFTWRRTVKTFEDVLWALSRGYLDTVAHTVR